ncbi:MAG: WG repeat-containing protein, partial [Bacteroidota bacterium]
MILPLIFFALGLPQLSAQQSYFQIKIDNQWGFMKADGTLLVPPAYDMVLSQAPHAQPELGYFGIFKNDKMGMYHQEKGELVPAIYDEVTLVGGEDRVDYIQILHQGHYGIADLEGNMVQAIELNRIRHLKGQTYAIKKGEIWQVWSASGAWSLAEDFETIEVQLDSLFVTHSHRGYSAWTLNGKLLIHHVPHRPHFFSPAFYAFEKLQIESVGEMVEDSTGETYWKGTNDTTITWGLHRLDGTLSIAPEYDSISWQADRQQLTIFREGKMGIMNAKGNILVEPEVADAFIDSVGYIWIKPKDTWAVLSPMGDTLFSPQFVDKSSFWRNVAIVKVDSGYGLINRHKEWLAEPVYQEIYLHPAGVARLNKNLEWKQVAFKPDGRRSLRMKLIVEGRGEYNSGWVSSSVGQVRASGPSRTRTGLEWYWGRHPKRRKMGYGLRDPQTDSIYFYPLFSSYSTISPTHLSIVTFHQEERNSVGLVDNEKGKLLAKPAWYQILSTDFAQGKTARIRDHYGLYHLMNQRGAVKKMPRVTFISEFDRGIALASHGGSPYRRKIADQWFPERESKATGKWGIITRNGQWILKPTYAFIKRFQGNWAQAVQKGKWGVIDRRGKEVVAPQYQEVEIITNEDSMSKALFVCKRNAPTYHFLDARGNLLFTHKF